MTVTSTTNPTPETCCDLKCDCRTIWTLAQQYAMRQIVTHPPVASDVPDYRDHARCVPNAQPDKLPPEFLSNFAVRARRIAASYAAMFLEHGSHGNKDQIGRFYWLGLGAFAAKQVAVTLEWPVIRASKFSWMYKLLGQGNLWLYNDILPWFYGYALDASSFDVCAKQRHSAEFIEPVATNFQRQIDYETAIPLTPTERDGESGDINRGKTAGYLKWTPLVQKGFDYVKRWEAAITQSDKQRFALNHLFAIAQHEQGEVLQGLIYDRILFKAGLFTQGELLKKRPTDNAIIAILQGPSGIIQLEASILARTLIPSLELVFSADDFTSSPEFKSAPKNENIALYNYRERMIWITDAASTYDKLMRNYAAEMRNELEKIARFSDLPDK